MVQANLSQQAYSWLSRATYGVSHRLIDSFIALAGESERERWENFVRVQLGAASFVDPETEARIQKLSPVTLGLGLPELWNQHFLASRKMNKTTETATAQPMTAKQEKKSRRARRELALEPVFDCETAAWMRIIYSPFQIYERMVEFWHDHFNIFAYEGRVAPAFLIFNRDVIRVHALGNFRQLLGAVCKNPAMLFYLDNAFNQAGNPNENFARELFELHTMGAENYLGTIERDKVRRDTQSRPEGYVDGDVYEAARTFTGWRVEDGSYGLSANTGQFHYSDQWHDRFQKVVLGEKLPEHLPHMKDGENVLDLLCSHSGTARHIVRKLCRRFVSDEPPESLITKVAAAFLSRKDSPTQLRDTLQDILLSPEYLTEKAGKFKRPVDFVASLLRALEGSFEPSERFVAGVNRCGHRLFGWRTPDGPPDVAQPWQSPQSVIERWRFSQQIIAGQLAGCEIDFLGMARQASTPVQLVDHFSSRMLGPRVSASLREQLVLRAAGGRRHDSALPESLLRERSQQVVELISMSPEFQQR